MFVCKNTINKLTCKVVGIEFQLSLSLVNAFVKKRTHAFSSIDNEFVCTKQG